MNPILKLVAAIVFSMLSEIFLRRQDVSDKANLAEAAAIAAIVSVGMSQADKIKLPTYLAFARPLLINEANLAALAKYLLDLAEEQANGLMDKLK